MMIYSAGIILHRKRSGCNDVEFFMCTPAGPYFRNKELWNFPKGQLDEGESPEDAAKREFKEETNIDLLQIETLKYVGLVKQRKGKSVYVFSKQYAGEDYSNCYSNTFVDERDGQEYPEIGDYRWMTIDEIRNRGGIPCYYKILEDIRAEYGIG